MTPEQRAQAVEYLDGPVRIEEVQRMLGVTRGDFAADWTTGRRDADAERDTAEAAFYLDAQAARARCVATLRGEAHATAGSRESSDLLRLVEHLTSELEPLAVADDEGPVSAPRLVQHEDAKIREAARGVQDSTRTLLRALAGTS